MTETKVTHTPGGWHCEKQHPDAEFTGIGEPVCVVGGEATGENVEFIIGRGCDFGPHGREQTEQNARLITAAVNSYDHHFGPNAVDAAEGDLLGELIEACQKVLDLNDKPPEKGAQVKLPFSLLSALVEALAKLK